MIAFRATDAFRCFDAGCTGRMHSHLCIARNIFGPDWGITSTHSRPEETP